MRKYAVARLISLILLLFLSGTLVDCASAQPPDLIVSIENPLAREIFNDTNVNLHFNVHLEAHGNRFWVLILSYTVYLDGALYNQTQTPNNRWATVIDESPNFIITTTQGEHTIRVDAHLEYIPGVTGVLLPTVTADISSAVNFFVYPGFQPKVSISGLDVETNQTTFNITTNEPYSTISYSLDGAANFTLPQNESSSLQNSYFYSVTVLGLSTGHHTITAYMKDALNHTAKAEETFTIGQSVPTLTIVAVVGAAIIAIASTVILLYRKSKNKTTSKT